jgi:PAS domain S-box-containing protein
MTKKNGAFEMEKKRDSGCHENQINACLTDLTDFIVKSVEVAIWEWDLLTGQLMHNEQWDKMLGYDPGEFPNGVNSWEIAVLPEDKRKVYEEFRSYLDGKSEIYECEYRMRRKDGVVIWVQDRGAVTELGEDGRAARVVGIKQNVTSLTSAEMYLEEELCRNERSGERRRKEVECSMKEVLKQDSLLKAVNIAAALLMSCRSENFEETMRESMKIVARSVDADRMFIRKNEERDGRMYTVPVYRWSAGEASCDVDDELMNDVAYDDTIPSWWNSLNAGITINRHVSDLPDIEREYLTRFGIKSMLMIPVFIDSEFWGFLSIDDCRRERLFNDTEKGVLNYAGLLIVSSILRNDTTENLIKAREEATSSAKSKSRFLANMSHEMRTPLNAVIGMATIAKNSSGDPKRMMDCIDKIDSASRHLLSLINNVLDMSKIDAKKFSLERRRYSLREMLDDIYNINIGKAEGKGVSLVFEISPNAPDIVMGDRLRLSQVISNLLSNAVKFTPANGAVRLSVKPVDDDAKSPAIEIAVEDNGIGIDDKALKNLFKPFEQADVSISRKYGGTGLGLAISRNIVEQMGGQLRVTSELGRGSRFFFVIPIELGVIPEKDETSETNVTHAADFDFRGKRILIAEDIEINKFIVSALLEDTGVDVDFAENGREAYEMFTASPDSYDMIYMDVQMPEVDGCEATVKIRESGVQGAGEIPIVAMTANAFAEDVERCLDSGMNDHISKPIDQSVLLKKTAIYTRKRQQTQKTGMRASRKQDKTRRA